MFVRVSGSLEGNCKMFLILTEFDLVALATIEHQPSRRDEEYARPFPSANGAKCKSLGQRPRYGATNIIER